MFFLVMKQKVKWHSLTADVSNSCSLSELCIQLNNRQCVGKGFLNTIVKQDIKGVFKKLFFVQPPNALLPEGAHTPRSEPRLLGDVRRGAPIDSQWWVPPQQHAHKQGSAIHLE